MVRKEIILLIVLFFINFYWGSSDCQTIVHVSGSTSAGDPVSWTPSVPNPGDILTITYDPTATQAQIPSSASQIYLMWGMYLRGNQLMSGKSFGAVPPSVEMWPPDTAVVPPYRFAQTALKKEGSVWTVSITINDKPDYLTCYFVDENGNQDKNGNAFWLINTELLENRITMLKPTFAEPLIVINTSEISILVDASVNATNWHLILSGVGDPVESPLSASYDINEECWTLSFTTPAQIGLYDMNVSATIGNYVQFNWQPNSLKLVKEFKTSYKFIVFADPQFHRDGSAGYAFRNEKTGLGNFTELLQEANTIHPEFILVAGDLTEWTDEIALMNFRRWCDLYLDDIPVVSIIGNHGDFESTANTGIDEWGSGKGMWENIIGPTEGIFYYGSHAFVRGDTASPQLSELPERYNFIMNALDEINTATMKYLMTHHPLVSYENPGGAETIQGGTERNAIINKLKSIGANAHFCGHWHEDRYDKIDELLLLITTEAVGDNPGYRIIEVKNDEIIKFSYGEPDQSTYSAPSNPINKVHTFFQNPNDGTVTSQTAAIQNCLLHEITEAHIRFKMKSGEKYSISGGTIYNSFIENGVQIIDALCDVSVNSSKVVSVSTGTPESFTIALPPCESSESSIAETTGSLEFGIFISVALIPIIRKKMGRIQ
ncbi:MAG: metallophosphoesterase family protein [Candidatus Thorarchaeota archaeon]